MIEIKGKGVTHSPYPPGNEDWKRVQAEDAAVKEQEAKDRKPEPWTERPLCFVEIDRYVTGQAIGSFTVYEHVADDEGKITRKVLAEGVGIEIALAAIEKAIRKRVYG